MTKRIVATLLIAGLLGGCMASGPNQTAGTIIGAGIGGAIGSAFGRGGGQVAATVGGAIIGGLIGGGIGQDLDEEERRLAWEAESAAFAGGAPRRWSGRPGYYGYVEPGPAVQETRGYCRPYSHTVFIDGRARRANGIACREADGSWRAVS